MKAKIQGIELEGTPEEIAEVIKLAGLVQEVQTVIRFVPAPQTVPTYPYPGTNPWSPWGTYIRCESGSADYVPPPGTIHMQ